MSKPEKLKLRDVPDDVEVVQEGGTIILRKIVDVKKLRAAVAAMRRHRPPLKKGADVLKVLAEARLRSLPR